MGFSVGFHITTGAGGMSEECRILWLTGHQAVTMMGMRDALDKIRNWEMDFCSVLFDKKSYMFG